METLRTTVGFTKTAIQKIRELGITDKLSDLANSLRGLPIVRTKTGLIRVEYNWYIFVLGKRHGSRGGLRVVDVQFLLGR